MIIQNKLKLNIDNKTKQPQLAVTNGINLFLIVLIVITLNIQTIQYKNLLKQVF